jgi:hypothetical protein
VLCLGSVLLRNNKKAIGLEVLDGEFKGKTMLFQKIKATVGNVYDAVMIDGDDGTPQSLKKLTWSEERIDPDRRARVVAASQAVDTQLTVKAQEQRLDLEEIFKGLAPLRREYHHTNFEGRLALEVRLLSWLRRGT